MAKSMPYRLLLGIENRSISAWPSELNVSREELAMRIGADQAYVSRIEADQRNVTLETVEQIALALHVEIVELLRV